MTQDSPTYDPPLKLMITTPSQIPTGYGPNATGKAGGNLRVRCTDAEYKAIQLQAQLLGLSLSNFCRSAILKTAKALELHRLANSTDIQAGDDEDGV